jgi:SAM-dependent methyltransferase
VTAASEPALRTGGDEPPRRGPHIGSGGFLAAGRTTPRPAAAPDDRVGRKRRVVVDPYEEFVQAVAAAQVAAWSPAVPSRILNLTPGPACFSPQLVEGGHQVISVVSSDALAAAEREADEVAGSCLRVAGDPRTLDWFRPESVDAVVAEGRALSYALATETAVEQAAHVLRPGGRLLLSVDSLVFGLAQLAEQHRWQELADTPSADVVLVPDAAGTLCRCFAPDELRGVAQDAGLEVEWLRPRTVLPAEVVRDTLRNDPAALSALIESELKLAAEREGESLGTQLVLSAVKPA